MVAAALIDTNVLVYRFDARFPEKQAIATKLFREGLRTDSITRFAFRTRPCSNLWPS
jgi:predicted nucleic acid-binding protein